jgi:hypothetical protein
MHPKRLHSPNHISNSHYIKWLSLNDDPVETTWTWTKITNPKQANRKCWIRLPITLLLPRSFHVTQQQKMYNPLGSERKLHKIKITFQYWKEITDSFSFMYWDSAFSFIKNKQHHKIWRFKFGQGYIHERREERGRREKVTKCELHDSNIAVSYGYWTSETEAATPTYSACLLQRR